MSISYIKIVILDLNNYNSLEIRKLGLTLIVKLKLALNERFYFAYFRDRLAINLIIYLLEFLEYY